MQGTTNTAFESWPIEEDTCAIDRLGCDCSTLIGFVPALFIGFFFKLPVLGSEPL
jgi:hypothetical protein